MIILPEQILYNHLSVGLKTIIQDYEDSVDKSDSFLYELLNGLTLDSGYDFYEQGKSLLLRKRSDPNKLDIRMFFDLSRASIPTIHITLPSENSDGPNGIGFDQGYAEDVWSNDETTKRVKNTRAFNTSYNIVCTSKNTYEVIILYNIVKALFITFIDSLELSGLRNSKISGGDLNLADYESGPNPFFARGIQLNIFYEFSILDFNKYKKLNGLFLENIAKIVPSNLSESGEKEIIPEVKTIVIPLPEEE